jgi:hypothetical protein
MSNQPVSLPGKLSAIVLAFFVIGFLGSSYLLGISYADDRIQLAGNHPVAAESATISGNPSPDAPLTLQIRFTLRHQAALKQLLADQQNPASASYHKDRRVLSSFRTERCGSQSCHRLAQRGRIQPHRGGGGRCRIQRNG